MPPHAAAAAPFRTETLLSTLMPDEVVRYIGTHGLYRAEVAA